MVPGKDEDYDFRITMHDELFGSVVDKVEDEEIFGGYEVVYNDGWMFDYWYERLP
jgi:hypothetical protein